MLPFWMTGMPFMVLAPRFLGLLFLVLRLLCLVRGRQFCHAHWYACNMDFLAQCTSSCPAILGHGCDDFHIVP
jgi:hypothetical protein